jgi:hypothetical protein
MNQRMSRPSQQVGEAVQLRQQGKNTLSHASLSEQYDGWMSAVSHFDLSMLRDLVKDKVPESTTSSEIESQVFSTFKETDDFRILTIEMRDAIGELENLFSNNSRHAAYVNQKLNLIMQRATITTDQSPADFGNQKANIVQFTCLRLKQLAALARQLRHSPPQGVNVQGYIDKLKDCVNNIAADAELCGPGVVQKVEDEFACLKLRLFPPSISAAIRQTEDYLAKQIIIAFCNQTYINTGQVQPGNQIHYVAAWQDRLIDSDPEFAHLPKNNDPFSPVLRTSTQNTGLQNRLKQQISTGATPVHACRFLAESAFQDIHGHMGSNTGDIGKNYAAFTEILQQVQTRYPGLTEHHFLESDDLYNFKLRSDTAHATLFFLKNLPESRFNPETIHKFDGLVFKQFGEIVWMESTDPETGESEVDFKVSVDVLFSGLEANDPRSKARIVQLLPIIGNTLFKTAPQERIRFLAELFQRGFGCNPAPSTQFLLAELESATDGASVLAAWLHSFSDPAIGQSLANKGYSPASLLEWHDKSNAIENCFTNSDFIVNGLIGGLVSHYSVRDVIGFIPRLTNPNLAYQALVASKARSAGNQRVPGWLRSNQWNHEVFRMKNQCKLFENYPAYLALKASETRGDDRPLKSVKPERLFRIIASGNLDCLNFALNLGANPNAFFVLVNESSAFPRVHMSILQFCIHCGKIEMVRALLDNGASTTRPMLFDGESLSPAEYAARLGRNEIAHLLNNF